MPRSRPRVWRIAKVRLRKTLRKLDRETPDWLRWLTPWGTSLVFHVALLLFLALVVRALNEPGGPKRVPNLDTTLGQLTDDVISAAPANHSGDPFTTQKSDEPPSLSLDKDPPKIDVIRTPRLPDTFAVGPVLNLVEREPGMPKDAMSKGVASKNAKAAKAGEGNGAFSERLPQMAPFSGRQAEGRAKMVRREGGTVESEKAVELGLDWIARHQRPDGAWSLDTNPMCKGTGCPDAFATESDTAATGLALLPLLGAGHTHTQPGRYQKTIERGLLWLIKNQRSNGELYVGGGMHTLYYSHAIAAMALCEAYGMTKDKRLRDPAQKAIYYINRNQNRFDGGWRYEPGQAGDTSVFGWQVFAMRSAHIAGLETNKGVLKRAREYLDLAASDGSGATYGYQAGWAATPSMTAEGLVCRQMLGWPRDHPALLAGAAGIAAHLEASTQRNIYYWYYATQLLHNMKGKEWEQWNVRVRDGLVAMQRDGLGCDRGSWDPSEPQVDLWGQRGGRLYTTSLSLLTLEVYYRYLPLYRDRGGEGGQDDVAPVAAGPSEKKEPEPEPAPARRRN